jgi:hypothetical protein
MPKLGWKLASALLNECRKREVPCEVDPSFPVPVASITRFPPYEFRGIVVNPELVEEDFRVLHQANPDLTIQEWAEGQVDHELCHKEMRERMLSECPDLAFADAKFKLGQEEIREVTAIAHDLCLEGFAALREYEHENIRTATYGVFEPVIEKLVERIGNDFRFKTFKYPRTTEYLTLLIYTPERAYKRIPDVVRNLAVKIRHAIEQNYQTRDICMCVKEVEQLLI